MYKCPRAQEAESTRPKGGQPWPTLLFRDSSSGQTPGNKDCPTFRDYGCLTQPSRACEQVYRSSPSTILAPFSPQAAPDVSQLPKEHVQPVHNAYGKNSYFWRCLDAMVGQCWRWGGRMLDVASWVGIPRAALASLGQAERRGMGGPGVFGTLRGLKQL